ncbi:MAG: hypothetical protein KKD44_16625 [Proteobacteria bacterium]|nr:hypothetical protein [Pseudomonadota bacterium]
MKLGIVKKILIFIAYTSITVSLSFVGYKLFYLNLTKVKIIDVQNVPPFFLAIGTDKIGVPKLLKLYQFSSHIQKVNSYYHDNIELIKDYGPILFKGSNNDYTYSLEQSQLKRIEKTVDLKIKFPNIENIKIKLDIKVGGIQKISITAVSDESAYNYIYEVYQNNIKPIAYGDTSRRKSWQSIKFAAFCFIVIELIGILIIRRI